MGLSFGHLVVLLVIILVVFGAGKLPKVMHDLGKGMKSFKDAVNDNPEDKPAVTKTETVNTPEQKASKDA